MSKTRIPAARPVADSVDPIDPVETPETPAEAENAPQPPIAVEDLSKVDLSDAEFVTVKTSGDFNLMDPYTGKVIDANSEGEKVVKTTFIADRLASKELIEV